MAYSGFIKYESGKGWRSILLYPIDPSFMQLFWEVFSKHDASERIQISPLQVNTQVPIGRIFCGNPSEAMYAIFISDLHSE